jgi:hypothetical protein
VLISFGIDEPWKHSAAYNYVLNLEEHKWNEKKKKMLEDEKFAKKLYEEDRQKQQEKKKEVY